MEGEVLACACKAHSVVLSLCPCLPPWPAAFHGPARQDLNGPATAQDILCAYTPSRPGALPRFRVPLHIENHEKHNYLLTSKAFSSLVRAHNLQVSGKRKEREVSVPGFRPFALCQISTLHVWWASG